MQFPRRQRSRFSGDARSESSSSETPDRAVDDDTEFTTALSNDSQSSVGSNFHDDSGDSGRYVPPILRLPPELVMSIFSMLSSPADLLSCMLVCKSWTANSVGILWYRPSCNNWDNLKRVAASVGKPNSLFSYSNLVKRLNLSALTDVNDGTVISFANCKRVERLTLTNCSNVTDKGVSDVIEGNGNLQALDVSELRSLTDHTLYILSQNCPRIQGLNISGCAKVTDDSLMVVSQTCRQLRRVRFVDCYSAYVHVFHVLTMK